MLWFLVIKIKTVPVKYAENFVSSWDEVLSLKTLCHFRPSWSEVATLLPDKLAESEIVYNLSVIKIIVVRFIRENILKK